MATTTTERRAVSAREGREVRTPGELGTWIFVFGDLGVFTVLFLAMLNERRLHPAAFESSHATLNVTVGLVNTIVLLTGSLLVAQGIRAAETRPHRARLLIVGGMASGIVFATLKIVEYAEKAHAGISPNTDEFFMYYFVLTGLHLFHVAVGICILGAAWVLLRRPLTPGNRRWLEGAGIFWHLVDALWILLFALLYLAG